MLAANLRAARIARRRRCRSSRAPRGLSKATLSSIENGRANPTVETLAGLAGALRVSISELLEELPLGESDRPRGWREIRERDGLPPRTIDELAGPAAVQIAELSLPAREARELEARAEGSRAHVLCSRASSWPARSSGSPSCQPATTRRSPPTSRTCSRPVA